ncbi:MAG TPA: PTS sugar transporter subunit IIA [Planctomycetia bacterium]|nr:PTS sugar transporter subunit IIA [Planctomycetia bacterium]
MEAETLDLPELARFLQRDLRDLEKLAARGRLPGRRVGGRWTVHRSELHSWLEQSIPDLDDPQLAQVEEAVASTQDEAPLLAKLIRPEFVSLELPGRTAPGVLASLVDLANATWQVYDPGLVLAAIRDREAASSTAQSGGVAVPHPAKRLPELIGDSILAFGRTSSGIPFGGPDGELTDLFFLVLAPDDHTHLHTLARLARLFLRPGFLDNLRAQESPAAVVDYLSTCESEIVE